MFHVFSGPNPTQVSGQKSYLRIKLVYSGPATNYSIEKYLKKENLKTKLTKRMLIVDIWLERGIPLILFVF